MVRSLTSGADSPMWTTPNLLTVGRVVAAPAVALAFAIWSRPAADFIAFCLFAGAGLTDFLDGWMARRYGQESAFGRMLDPIADKAMAIIALAALLGVGGLGWPLVVPTVVILTREVLVSGLREFLKGAKVMSVTRLAKWKTTMQLFAIGVLLAAAPADALHALAVGAGEGGSAGGAVIWPLGLALLWIAAALTAITGWDYFRKGLAYIRAEEGGSP